MLTHEELYEGLPKEKGEAYRQGAIDKYGKKEVECTENHLSNLGKVGFEQLKAEQQAIAQQLVSFMQQDPTSEVVQAQIALHYQNIRQFWGTANSPDKQAEAYKGLGQLYVSDERFTIVNGQPNPAYALFLSKAMSYFADAKLK